MLDKMQFALQDIQMTHEILKIKNSSFFKRAISRIIAIRVPDFIQYAREANNDRSDGRPEKDRRTLKENLNALDTLYKDYIADLRNKFGGHFKDIDFFERIQLWGQINEEDIKFFVSHVEEYAKELAFSAGVSTGPKIDQVDIDIIARISSEQDLEGKPTIATDALALSRNNTVAALQIHELHAKAGILSSLRILINYSLSILREISQPEVMRVFKCLVLIDVINFFDNLFTRPVDPSAKQAMDGLDVLVERHGLTAAKEMFKTVKTEMKITENLEALRSIRNVIAAHIDHNQLLSAILIQFNGVTLDDIMRVYDLMNNLFQAICRKEIALSTALLPPTSIPGAIAVERQPQTNFSKNDTPQTVFSGPSYSRIEMEQTWYALKQNPDDQEALNYFRTAMSDSPIEEKFCEEVQISENVTKNNHIDIRSVHKFLQQKLKESRGDIEKTNLVIYMLIHGKTTFPAPLLRILEEEYEFIAEPKIRNMFILAFGELARIGNKHVVGILTKMLDNNDIKDLYISFTAILKIDVRENGIRYANRNTPSLGPDSSEGKLDEVILEHLVKRPAFVQIVLVLIMLSELMFTDLGMFFDYAKIVYLPRLESILSSSISKLLTKTAVSSDKIAEIIDCITKHLYGWIGIELGDALKDTDKMQSRIFYEIVAHGIVRIDWKQDCLVQANAIALAKLNQFADAVRTVLYICEMQPHLKNYRLLALQLAAEGKLSAEFEDIYSKLEHDFKLDTKDVENIEEMKTWL